MEHTRAALLASSMEHQGHRGVECSDFVRRKIKHDHSLLPLVYRLSLISTNTRIPEKPRLSKNMKPIGINNSGKTGTVHGPAGPLGKASRMPLGKARHN